eukprot:gene29891-36092_t
MSALLHRTVFERKEKVAVQLNFSEELRQHHPDGTFPLLKDPITRRQTAIIGMFVLRPALGKPYSSKVLDDTNQPTSLYDSALDWAFNVNGLDGGWLIANGSAVDAYRLGMQYGLADAVIVGTNTVAAEGVARDGKAGYLWQPYGPLSWAHVHAADPDVQLKISRQREAWQQLGYLSLRTFPAQVVFSLSGEAYPATDDFLAASIFHERYPTGERIEVYIVTTENGALLIKERCHLFGLQERIDEILIVVPPPASASPSAGPANTMDLSLLPAILYNKYDIRLANHDGGQVVLREFARADQMNLTLGRHTTVQQAVQRLAEGNDGHPHAAGKDMQQYLRELRDRTQYFFGRDLKGGEDCGVHAIPRELEVVSLLESAQDEVAVVTFALPSGGIDWWK